MHNGLLILRIVFGLLVTRLFCDFGWHGRRRTVVCSCSCSYLLSLQRLRAADRLPIRTFGWPLIIVNGKAGWGTGVSTGADKQPAFTQGVVFRCECLIQIFRFPFSSPMHITYDVNN
jgi:hypothetical protein